MADGDYKLKMVDTMVLDEADSLFDDSFNASVKSFLSKLRLEEVISFKADATSVSGIGAQIAQKRSQLILAGATMPRSLQTILGTVVPIESIQVL